MKLVTFIAVCVALGTVLIAPASCMGDSLTVGSSVTPTALSSLPDFGGFIAELSEPFTLNSASGTATGTATSFVYVDTSTHGLDFVYRITVSAGSTDVVDALSMSAFGGSSTDVDYIVSSGDNTPTAATRPSDNVIDFYFTANDISAGEMADELLIETNDTTNFYGQGSLSLVDGGSATVPSFGTTPEPGAFLLFGSGLVVLFGTWSRLSRSQTAVDSPRPLPTR